VPSVAPLGSVNMIAAAGCIPAAVRIVYAVLPPRTLREAVVVPKPMTGGFSHPSWQQVEIHVAMLSDFQLVTLNTAGTHAVPVPLFWSSRASAVANRAKSVS